MATDNNLSELINTLTEKIEDDKHKNQNFISVDTFGKIISDFNGENIPIRKWFEIFEENAEAYELNIKQMYVQARNKITGVAKSFLETEKCDSFEIHNMLSYTKKKRSETFNEYILNMKRIANLANIEERATIRYIADGTDIADNVKHNLYNPKTFKELREQYEIHAHIIRNRRSTQNIKKTTVENKEANNKQQHCFNCGSKDHKRSECKTETKCFKCNKFGHIAKNCICNISSLEKH